MSTNKENITDIDTNDVWKNLGDDVIDIILSHLILYKIIDILMTLLSALEFQIYSHKNDQSILNHKKHVASSICFIKVYRVNYKQNQSWGKIKTPPKGINLCIKNSTKPILVISCEGSLYFVNFTKI